MFLPDRYDMSRTEPARADPVSSVPATSPQRREELPLANTRHADDASQGPFWQWPGAMNRDGHGVRMSILHHHVMATLYPVESKTEFAQSPDSIFA
jgi:hypothetical protein